MLGTVAAAAGIRIHSTEAAPAIAADPGGPYRGLVGETLRFNSGNSTGSNLSFAWDFGDGTAGVGVVVSHVYPAAGIYTVSLTVTDASDQTARATTTATIDGGNAVNRCVMAAFGQVLCTNAGVAPWVPDTIAGCVLTMPGLICRLMEAIPQYAPRPPIELLPKGMLWVTAPLELAKPIPICTLPFPAPCGVIYEHR